MDAKGKDELAREIVGLLEGMSKGEAENILTLSIE
jgi:hypothetical protein